MLRKIFYKLFPPKEIKEVEKCVKDFLNNEKYSDVNQQITFLVLMTIQKEQVSILKDIRKNGITCYNKALLKVLKIIVYLMKNLKARNEPIAKTILASSYAVVYFDAVKQLSGNNFISKEHEKELNILMLNTLEEDFNIDFNS